MRKQIKNLGFSLVELSISLTIIGMIAASALSVAINSDEYGKITETNTKLDRIEEALAGFVALNQRLPCPADLTDLQTDADFGLEGDTSLTACEFSNFSSSYGRIGAVPVRTLQLPDDFMFDGWGRRIVYKVDYRYTNSESTNSGTCTGTAGNDCFRDETGNTGITIGHILGGYEYNSVYVLTSHGQNGHGAFTKYGGATRINGFPAGNPYRDTTYSEYTNANYSKDGAPTGPSTITWVEESVFFNEYYDDIIRHKNKERILKDAGATFYESVCKTATDIVETTGTNDCTGANSEAECESFATELYSACLN